MERKAPVSTRAIIARINRAIAPDQKRLCVARKGTRAYEDFGPYYIIEGNIIKNTYDDLEELARTLKVLSKWERLQD